MIEFLPAYVPITFVLTTFAAVGILLTAIKRTDPDSVPAKIAVFLIGFWLFFTAILGVFGFYLKTDVLPPRIFAFGAMPGIILSILIVIFAGRSMVEKLPLKLLTIVHVVRIPVELVLLWLSYNLLVPRAMTFEGHNFDILSGITAPFVAWLAFRGGRVNRPLLIIWNIAAMILLLVIVTTAVLAFPSPIQSIAFDQPNKAVAYFPFVWLPSIVVPIVFFSHLVAFRQLASGRIRA